MTTPRRPDGDRHLALPSRQAAGSQRLSACTTQTGPRLPGYLYYDANHPNAVSAPSTQAIYDATHGT
jgi:hypothetical protein